jgi:transcriptional regulator with XRE-family HTH domain
MLERRRNTSRRPLHPLRQWRGVYGVTQDELSAWIGMSQGGISHVERFSRRPHGIAFMVRLMERTGLPMEAFILPERFLQQYPDFLQRFPLPAATAEALRTRMLQPPA